MVAVPVKPAAVVLLRLCILEEAEEVEEGLPIKALELDDANDCLVACEDFRCFDADEDDVRFVVILMLVADVDDAVVLAVVESTSFSGDEPESEEVS